MGSSSGSRAEAAYARAMSAFQEGSLDAARRLVAEALAADPNHAGAKALRTRIESRLTSAANPFASRPSRTPEVTSVDPTILIDRAAHRAPDYVEPTVMIQREEAPAWHRQERPAPPPPPPPPYRPSRATPAPAPEPTVLISPKKKPAPTPGGGRRPPSDSFFSLLWLRLKGVGGDSGARRAATGKAGAAGTGPSPAARGVLMAVGGLVVAALLVFAVVALWRAFVSPTYVLTINKPLNGTIVGDGVQCGTRGNDCEISKKASDTVTLEAVADSGYVWSGFTGDCAPAGRVAMTQARTCGATFGSVNTTGPGGATVWPLTIIKPTGGTIVAAGGIICGTLGTVCSVNLPDGVPVTLTFEADAKFKFLTFTGDCSATGETTMTGARTCGATFAETQTPVVSVLPGAPPVRQSPSAQKPAAPPPTAPPVAAAPPPPTQQQAPPPPTVPTPSAAPPVAGDSKPAPPPQTEEEHAKKEIGQLVKTYCAELETLQPQRVQKVYPNVDQRTLREQFRQYKSLKCTLTGDLEYDRIDVNGAGGAQVKTGMKQTIATQAGGAPQTLELNVTIVVSRMDNRTPWTIDRVNYAPKPK